MSAARIRELLAKADCLTPLEVELRNEISPLLNQVERLEVDARRYQWLRKNRGGNRSKDKPWAMIFDDDLEKYIDEQLAALRGKGE